MQSDKETEEPADKVANSHYIEENTSIPLQQAPQLHLEEEG